MATAAAAAGRSRSAPSARPAARAAGLAARGRHERRAAQAGLPVRLVDLDVACNEPDEHDEHLARVRVEAGGHELLWPVFRKRKGHSAESTSSIRRNRHTFSKP